MVLRCRGDSEGGKRGKRRGGEGEVVEEGGDLTGEGRSNLYWDPLLLPIPDICHFFSTYPIFD